MKKHHTLECAHNYDFVVLAINSHSKAYKFCWALNKFMNLNFEITEGGHKINENLIFTRYRAKKNNGQIVNLLVNRSKEGYIIPSKKSVNYFLIIDKYDFFEQKESIISKLRKIKDVLLVFKLDLKKEKNSDRFIIYDKKN